MPQGPRPSNVCVYQFHHIPIFFLRLLFGGSFDGCLFGCLRFRCGYFAFCGGFFGYHAFGGNFFEFAAQDFRGFVPDIVDLRATSFGALHEVDFLDLGRVEREDDFYADAKRNFADGNGWRGALTALFGNNHAFEDLEAFFGAFFDLAGDAHDVAGSNRGEIGSPLGKIEGNQFLIHIGSITKKEKQPKQEGFVSVLATLKDISHFVNSSLEKSVVFVSTRRKPYDTLGKH